MMRWFTVVEPIVNGSQTLLSVTVALLGAGEPAPRCLDVVGASRYLAAAMRSAAVWIDLTMLL
jgi:hypothetical protein